MVDDDAFASDPHLELIGPLPGLDHQIGGLRPDLDGRPSSRGGRLDVAKRVKVVAGAAVGMLCDCRLIDPSHDRLGVGRWMHASVGCHFIEGGHVRRHPVVQVPGQRAEVHDARQTVHDLHGPDAPVLGHDKPGPVAAVGAGAGTTEHDDRRGVEALVSQLRAKFALEEIRGHVLLVDGLHRQDGRVEIGSAGRRRVDIGPERLVPARHRVE